jgi:type IV pilus assembly protein PilC
MAKYAYEAIDLRGVTTRGALDVSGQSEALQRLREMGVFPTRVTEAKPERPVPRSVSPAARLGPGWLQRRLARTPRVATGALAVFTRQLATLVGAGLPLLRGLRLLEEQEPSAALRQVVRGVARAVEEGNTFSEGLARYPQVFNRLYINLVQAGEAGGMQDVVLARLADFMEKSQRIRAKVTAAMFYPMVVLFIATGILAALMMLVVPGFETVFKDLLGGRPLPPFTQGVLGTSRWMASHGLWLAGGVVGGALLLARCTRTGLGRRLVDRAKLRLPLLGPLVRKIAVARLARTLGTLLGSGVPILQALTIARETAGNVVVGGAVAAIGASVKEGGTVTEPMAASGVFPSMVVGLVDVGEQTGALPEMLEKVADTFDAQVESTIGALTSLLEPVLIVLLAVIVGSIVIALYLPILGIVSGMTDPNADAAGRELP